MVFSSPAFLFTFFPPVLALYLLASKRSVRWQNLVLTLSGYVFYGWAGPQFVPLMLATTMVDWTLSLVISANSWRFWRAWSRDIVQLPSTRDGAARSPVQRQAIWLSVVSNLALLGYFKYFNFLWESYASLATAGGFANLDATDLVRVALPLGISFYTFQSLSYTIDVYRGEARAMGNFLDFACFVAMFPHLVAGPILKFSFLSHQLENRTCTVDKFARGVAFFSLGLAKKVVLANTCATVADATFGAGSLHPLEAWWGALAYCFQIYFDFSGYSDMAIGLGLMLGFVFARNFQSPYRAVSITDFWRRWHISLSSWLREYLYIPLGGNKKGQVRTYVNLLLTMLLGGLWHGASWNFVWWGAMQGAALAWERYRNKSTPLIPAVMAPLATFAFVLVSWVVFRSQSGEDALNYLGTMLGLAQPTNGASLVAGLVYTPLQVLAMLAAATCTWLLPETWEWTQQLTPIKATFCMAGFWATLILLTTQTYQPFIYFVF